MSLLAAPRAGAAIAAFFVMAATAGTARNARAEPPQEATAAIHLFTQPEALNVLTPGEAEADDVSQGWEGRPGKGEGVIWARKKVGAEWEKISVSFTASKAGTVDVNLRGDKWRPDKGGQWEDRYVFADDVEVRVDGEPIDIGGGLEPAGRGLAPGWQKTHGQRTGFAKAAARNGELGAVVADKAYVGRPITVQPGKTYTVSAWFRTKPDPLSPPENMAARAAPRPADTPAPKADKGKSKLPPKATAAIHLYTQPDALNVLTPGETTADNVSKGFEGRPDKGEGVIWARKQVGPGWEKLSLSFTAQKADTVDVNLRGDHWRPDSKAKWQERYVFADDVTVEADGQPVEIHGDLEPVEGDATSPWRVSRGQTAGFTEAAARNGKLGAEVSVSDYVGCPLKVEPGKTYTVAAWFRAKPDGLAPPAQIKVAPDGEQAAAGTALETHEDLSAFVPGIGVDRKKYRFAVWGDPQVAFWEEGYWKTKLNDRQFKSKQLVIAPRLLETVKLTNEKDPAFVVTVGDNIHGIGEIENYRVFVDCVKDLRAPIYLLVGNHDHGPRTRFFEGNPYGTREFGNFLWAQKQLGAPELVNYSFNAGDWHFVIFCQPASQDHYMNQYPEWFEWLEQDMERHKDMPTFFFAHHPLLPVGRAHFDSYNLNAAHRRRLADILTKHGNLKYAFFGHIHNSVSSIPLISWRWRGAAFVMMPNAANVVRFNDFREQMKSSWGTGIVEVDGPEVASIDFYTLENEVVPIDPSTFEEYDDEAYCFLRPMGGMPSPPQLDNGGFEKPLRGVWFVNDVIPYDGPQTHRQEIREGGAAEGDRYLYLYTLANDRPRPPKNYVVAEARQAVRWPGADAWPRLELKYRILPEEFKGPEGGNANVIVSGHREGEAGSVFALIYALGGDYARFAVTRFRGPVKIMNMDPELGEWTDLALNVRADYEALFPGHPWEDLGLHNLVVTLGNFNDDYAPGGEPTEIGVGFDAVKWNMLSEPTGPTPGFQATELVGDRHGHRGARARK